MHENAEARIGETLKKFKTIEREDIGHLTMPLEANSDNAKNTSRIGPVRSLKRGLMKFSEVEVEVKCASCADKIVDEAALSAGKRIQVGYE